MRHLAWIPFLIALVMFADTALMSLFWGPSISLLGHRLLLPAALATLWFFWFFNRPRRWLLGSIKAIARETWHIIVPPPSCNLPVCGDGRALALILLLLSALLTLGIAKQLRPFARALLGNQPQWWGYVCFEDVNWLGVLVQAVGLVALWLAARGIMRRSLIAWRALLGAAALTAALSGIAAVYAFNGLRHAPPGVTHPIGMPPALRWLVLLAGSLVMLALAAGLTTYLVLRRRALVAPAPSPGFPIEITPAQPAEADDIYGE